jgi:hypothetical protein
MTIKDYVYLGLILLTALAFYCNGFYAGVCRSKRVYETLLDDAEQADEGLMDDPILGKSLAPGEKGIDSEMPQRESRPSLPRKELRGDFGHN